MERDSPPSGPPAQSAPLSARALGDSDAAHAVAETLRNRIVKGDLLPGTRIVERKLSAELQVSRPPVREALKLLRADGLIEISLHRGAQVTAYSAAEALNLFDVIAVLESRAARHLTARFDADLLDRLEGLHAQVVHHHRRGALDAYFAANSAVHDTIVAECGNPELADAHRRLMMRARRGRFLAIMDSDRWSQAVAEHEALMAAIRSGDAASAAGVWDQHLQHTGEAVAAILREAETTARD
jgi:DNA-binding GntR family transcriptional regulator